MSDFNLGTVTAYGYAKDKGYTGTENEYAELMASYADVAEQAAESATQAATSATTATAKASEAAQSATAAASSKTAAQTAKTGAETAAQTATTKAGEASTSATTASNKATEATTAATTATGKATEAAGSATTATTKAGEASTSATNAAASATRAQEILDSIPADYSQLSEDVDTLKDGLNNFANFTAQVDSDISIGTLTTGSYISPTTGENGALAYGCRSGYIDIFLGGSSSRVLPLMLSVSFDTTVYKYTVWGYGLHSVSSATENFTENAWTTNKSVLIKPSADTICIRFTAIRIDGQGSITTEQAADIASKVKLMQMTDTTLSKDGISADARATGDRITPLESYVASKEQFPVTTKIVFFGDSIMWGRDGASSSALAQVDNPIPAIVQMRTGADCTNLCRGGMGYMRPCDHMVNDGDAYGKTAYQWISEQDLSTYDVIVMGFGGNDGYYPVGEWDALDTDTATSCMGQFNKIINYIYSVRPDVTIVVIGAWNGENVGNYPDYWYGDVTGAAPTESNPDRWRYSRMLLNNALARACEYYWIAYIPVFDCPINPAMFHYDKSQQEGVYLPDGVHPIAAVYDRVGIWMADKLREYI